MRIENAPGVRGELLADGRKHPAAAGGCKNPLTDQSFQSLHLRRYGRGCSVDDYRGSRK